MTSERLLTAVANCRLPVALIVWTAVAIAASPEFFATTLYPVLDKAGCKSCHHADGVASATRLHFPAEEASTQMIGEFGNSLVELVDRARSGKIAAFEQADESHQAHRRRAHQEGQRRRGVAHRVGKPSGLFVGLAKRAGAVVPKGGVGQRRRAAESHAAEVDPPAVRQHGARSAGRILRSVEPVSAGGFRGRLQEPVPVADSLSRADRSLQRRGRATAPARISARRFPPPDSVPVHRAGCGEMPVGVCAELRPQGFPPAAGCKRDNDVREDLPGRERFPQRRASRNRKHAAGAQLSVLDGRYAARRVEAVRHRQPAFLFAVEHDAGRRPSALRRREGELDSSAGVERTARRMLADPRAKPALDEFTSQWLRFDRALAAARERRSFPMFSRELVASMLEESRRFVGDLVWNDRNFMDVFRASYGFVNADLAAVYKVPAPAHDFDRTEFPADQERAGVLGQALFLTLTSKPEDTAPTGARAVRTRAVPVPAGSASAAGRRYEPAAGGGKSSGNQSGTAGRAHHQQGLLDLPQPDRSDRIRPGEVRRHRRPARKGEAAVLPRCARGEGPEEGGRSRAGHHRAGRRHRELAVFQSAADWARSWRERGSVRSAWSSRYFDTWRAGMRRRPTSRASAGRSRISRDRDSISKSF